MISIPRPQPVGILPFPRSHLLAAGADAAADVTPEGGVSRYNAFVLAPSREKLLAIEVTADETLVPLARAAAFAHGLVDDLPEPGTLDGELKALVLMTAAAGLFERGEARAARTLLLGAADAAEPTAPVFAAVLLLQLAETLPAEAAEIAIEHLERAERLAEDAVLPRLRADIWMRLGTLHQARGADGSRGPLVEAVTCYQKALAAGITPDADPAGYGQLQNNLGLAYLCMPTREASDQLRAGIAVQSFRKAREVQDREADPDQWARVTMNLANTLQYLPSAHPAENLAEAVELYEEVLAVRTEARDPVAHARVLLNQANALAHLGIFKPAIEKLATSLKLLSWHESVEEAATAKDLLDGIQARMDEIRVGSM